MKKNIRKMRKAANIAARKNLKRGTFLAWNGGIATVEEFADGVALPAGYARLVIDRTGDDHGAIVIAPNGDRWSIRTRRIDNMIRGGRRASEFAHYRSQMWRESRKKLAREKADHIRYIATPEGAAQWALILAQLA